ncbi:long-chain fatty acid--CoA ligase, partial [Corynebacterium sp. KPL4035]|uniref:AMP-binding enzyme n=1 Tax=Corynebacterium sp. KPL4035 TaxID=3135441 RepID=UPI0030C94524
PRGTGPGAPRPAGPHRGPRPPPARRADTRWAYRISQGRIPASLEYRVVNDGQVVARTDRNAGELQVRGNLVTGSYYHSPTAEPGEIASEFRGKQVEAAEGKFTADGWLRTGDVGSVTKDGFLTVEDRARDVIRSGGEWIYSVQLENLIMSDELVVEAAVIGYPDKQWVERPLAVTVLAEGASPTIETAERLRASMRKELPSWMLPEYWTFVKSIDKTSVGKFDKKDLRTHLAEGEYNIIRLKGPGESQRLAATEATELSREN